MPAFIFLCAALLSAIIFCVPAARAEDALKVAIGQRGVYENSISELGQQHGFFKQRGLVLELLYTQGGGETQQAVISGAVDIGIGVGTLGAMGAFAKGAPVLVLGATMRGAYEYWYVPAASPIRSFRDADGKMNRDVTEAGGGALIVSQFTLYGDCRKGRRPSFIEAAPPAVAIPLYEAFIHAVKAQGVPIATGQFGADMQVDLVNDGPVTLVIDAK